MNDRVDAGSWEEAVHREADRRFRAMADALKAAVFRVRLADGDVEFANDMAREILGLEPSDMQGSPRRHADLLTPEGRAILEAEWPRLCAGNPSPTLEYTIVRRDGETRRVCQGNTVVRDAEGRPLAVHCVLTDITPHWRQEEELRRTREIFRAAIDDIPGWLTFLTPDGRYVVANRKYTESFGTPVSEIEGRLWWEVFPSLVPVHKPLFERCVAGEVVPFDDVIPFDPARPSHVHGVYRPVFGPDGAVRYVSAVVLDITDRVLAEEALAAETERLAVTLRGIADGVLATDAAGRVVLANPVAEELTGWPATEALGRPLAEVFRTVEDERAFEGPGEDGRSDHRILLRRDGRRMPVSGKKAGLLDAGGRPCGEVVVFRDLTRVFRRREEALQAQKLESLAVLAGGLAHDFNNLLTGVLGNLSLALSRPNLPDDARGWLEDAEAAGVRAQGLTQQLLTFARGGAPVSRVTNLGPIVQQVASFSSLGATVACRVGVDPALWPAQVDEGQVAQVIQNLVLNAIEAMPGGGEMSVDARNEDVAAGNTLHLAPGPYVVIRVADRGVGIPEAVRARIFDPYFSTKQRRSGLGLAVSHSIVVRHGGRIHLESEVGRGSTFEVFLPARPGTRPEEPSVFAPAAARGGAVLVMDDDPFVRRLMERTLARLGHGVATAEDGCDALRMYREAREAGRPYDAVILDLTVPGGIGGVETMAALRGMDPGVRAIVMSGYSDNPVLAHYRDHGFAAILPKPFNIERLRAVLAQVLGEAVGTG